MLRHAVLPALLLVLSAGALPARAQVATYCSGAIQVMAFYRQIVPGTGLTIFEGQIRNASTRPQTFQISALPPVQTHSSVPITLGAGRTRPMDVGNQRTPSGTEPLAVDQLARYIRIACQ